ncbi:MAG: hypothetical protein CMG00_02460 [Candidatus Marinimicrobia bacterium]|nr:hypothetical protein [Candidatus Neomarinimicrobiota bacterium]
MGNIKKLKSNIVNNIAAGEIIESPSSVVKELIENSIDAKSRKINVFIKDYGLKNITVKDDGLGILKDDLKLAFSRHATSKIFEKKDLNGIKTLGFRGEALPSIASVSMLSAVSKTSAKSAIEIKINGGEIKSFKKASSVEGTSVKVENLFYNLPARKKFLKNESKELNKITGVVKAYALCYPSIQFKYIHNNREIYNLPASNLKNRIIDIFGKRYSNSIIKVDYLKEDYKIEGFTGNMDLLRKRNVNQFIFLNKRLIKDSSIAKAIRNPYLSAIKRNEYPFCVLNISMPYDSVDVNVHPNKNEVRFKNQQHIYHIIKRSISESIKHIVVASPSFYSQFDRVDESQIQNNLDFRDQLLKEIPDDIQKHFVNYQKFEDEKIKPESMDEIVENELSQTYYDINDIWQIHLKYLLTEINGGLLIIDQHVAHERILYEMAKDRVDKNGLESQTLLFPQYLEFEDEEYSHIVELYPYLNKLGFRIREFGNNTIIVESSPIETPFGKELEIIREILDLYIKHNEISSSFIDNMCATYACKAAIKAGEKLESQEMKHLVNRLFFTKNPYYCPHGRPIIINLTEDELDERFERK